MKHNAQFMACARCRTLIRRCVCDDPVIVHVADMNPGSEDSEPRISSPNFDREEM